MNPSIIIVITIILSAFFSGMEIAFFSANRLTLEMDKQKKSFTATILSIFTSRPEQFISTMLVGNNIALVVYGLATARLLEPHIENFIQSDILVLLVQTLLSTLVILFTAEFLPKTLFRLNANGLLKIFAVPVMFFYIILYPISRIFMSLSNFIIKFIAGKKPSNENEGRIFSKIDLDHYINQPDLQQTGNDNTDNEETEIKLFKNALDFSNVKVRDCMVPRTEIESVEENTPVKELANLLIKTGFSKILVYRQSIDNMIGYIHTSQLFKNPHEIKSIVNPISIVPETMPASKLLSFFTQKRKSIAVVVDEFGGTSGLITTEDILEEIFGEIEDEHDVDELTVKNIKNNEWILSGRYEISFLNEKYHFNLPEDDEYDTLAGLIIHQHENIPKVNTIITINQFEFRILKATKIRIELVLMKILDN
ncbi:MAG: HlyC/CorC family transporter [Prolixibacteraceae bacterium]|nr:HlyC/CorC family transporter [Prolixibacteraceae bacterium]MBN2650243.1 HlyC/CorC family transporter [Prolixibacteraceae bacterium]